VVPLVVILGAGASRASGAYAPHGLPPPLTVDLFSESAYGEILASYDIAHQAGRFITHERDADEALALERVLHGLRVSDSAHHKHMAIAVPPYLQDLLHRVSTRHYSAAFRYDRLIERVLRLPYVFFLTLNYDVMLDRRLSGFHRLSTLDDYITRVKNWSLIKLHGSVNWFHRASRHYDPRLPPRDLEWDSSFGCAAPNAPLSDIREAPERGNTWHYPALALPEGPDDRLVLPKAHLDFLQGTLQTAQKIDVLVIGYSGLDQEVLSLLVRANSEVRRMTVVGRSYEGAVEVYQRFNEAGLGGLWPNVVSGDFKSWADGGGLNRLVDEYDGPY
jgi:hypothetical protein